MSTAGIFYIPTLDTSSNFTIEATAEGAVVTAPLGSISTMTCDVSYNGAMASFSFKSVSGDDFENFTSTEGVVEANFLGLPKTKNSGPWALAADTSKQEEEILQVLARAVTGSSYGSDLFNNQKDMALKIEDALTACNNAVSASEDVSASLILTNAILATKPERFLLSNGVTTDLKNGDCMNTSVYNNLFCESITDGINASVSINVELSGNEIYRMKPLAGTSSGIDFSAGDSIQITDSSGQSGMGTGIVLADISGIRNATTISELNKSTPSMFTLSSAQNAEWLVHNNVPGLFTSQELTCKTGTSKVNVSFSGDISDPTSDATCINLAIVVPDSSKLAALDSSMNIVIKGLNGKLGDVSNNEINSVGVGLINGTFDSSSGMATPLIPGDKIQVLFTIKPHTTQKTLTGHPLRENEGVSTMLAEYEVGPKS